MGDRQQRGWYDNGIPDTVHGGNFPLLQHAFQKRIYFPSQQQEQIYLGSDDSRSAAYNGGYLHSVPFRCILLRAYQSHGICDCDGAWIYHHSSHGDYKIHAKIVYDKETVGEIYNTEDPEKLKELIWQEVKKVNKTMPAYKYIREITLTDKELIKTTTQKVKRFEEIKTVLK